VNVRRAIFALLVIAAGCVAVVMALPRSQGWRLVQVPVDGQELARLLGVHVVKYRYEGPRQRVDLWLSGEMWEGAHVERIATGRFVGGDIADGDEILIRYPDPGASEVQLRSRSGMLRTTVPALGATAWMIEDEARGDTGHPALVAAFGI
jgi:hypothetical protein